MNAKSATVVGVFTLGLAAGALSAPFLPGVGTQAEDPKLELVLEDLEAEFGQERVNAALIRAEERLDAAGLY